MKIFYGHYLNDPAHPAAQMVQQIAANLRILGHEVLVHGSELDGQAGFQQGAGSAEDANKTTNAPLKTRIKNKLWFAKAMLRNRRWRNKDHEVLRSFDPDIVLSRQDAYCWSQAQAASELGLPIVTYADAPVAYETRMFNDANRWHPKGLVEKLELWGLEKSEAIITVSNPARAILEQYPMATPVSVAHNGVDLDKFIALDGSELSRLRRELQLQNKIVIGFQGTFKMFHGIDRLLELMKWSRRYENVCWLLVGDGPERSRVERSVKGDVPVVFAGRQPSSEMSKYLSLMDIAVAPHSQMDGKFYFCPLKILEYAAAGCATLASRQGDIPILLAEGKGGYIVGDDRLNAWTRGLAKLIEDEVFRKQSAKAAQKYAYENLSWQNTAKTVEAVLAKVLGLEAKQAATPQLGMNVFAKCAKPMSLELTHSR